MTVRPARVSRGAIIGGRFRLERLLGTGGMGVVWAARDNRLGRSVAVKLLGSEAMAKPQLRQRFAREARITSRIRSPHVAQVIADGVTSAGVPFVAMELLEGESLAAHLAHVGRCSLVTAGVIVEQVCRALSSAHVVGLVHRDVKPANIFLTQIPNSGDVFVRLLDFGIAKELLFSGSAPTQTGEMLGTADYMSPEQLCSPESVGTAADIWSLGVVLYELLTGKRPFEENTFPQLVLRIAQGDFLPPSQICPDLPPAVDHVVARALATDPSQRYATAAELSTALSRVVRGHSSDSVVRPDVLKVLQGFGEQSQQDIDPFAAEEEHAIDSYTAEETTLREKLTGVLLVVLCIAVVVTSWLASATLDNTPARPRRPILTSHSVVASPAPAEIPPQPSAAEPEAPQPELSAIATPAPDTETETNIAAVTQQPIAAQPTPVLPLKPAKPKHVEKPPAPKHKTHAPPPPAPPSAALQSPPISAQESKYGF